MNNESTVKSVACLFMRVWVIPCSLSLRARNHKWGVWIGVPESSSLVCINSEYIGEIWPYGNCTLSEAHCPIHLICFYIKYKYWVIHLRRWSLPLIVMPCQCIDSPSSLGSEFMTSTTSVSPERASIVGPGNSSIVSLDLATSQLQGNSSMIGTVYHWSNTLIYRSRLGLSC